MVPVILSGGKGTRLWPVSRARFPKPFCELLDSPLMDLTLSRLKKLGSPWIVTSEELKTLTQKTFQKFGLPAEQILFEPIGCNTAPAIALLCRVFEVNGQSQEVLGIFPADHLVRNEDEFLRALKLAEKCALKGQIVTIGIRPEFPSTGFGYIETTGDGVQTEISLTAFETKGFREKPNLEVAKEFLAAGNFFWNAGIFVFQVQTMIDALQAHLPKTWQALKKLKPDLSNLKEIYSSVDRISIDYAVMEKVKNQLCIPADLGWSDVGSWDEVIQQKDSHLSQNVYSEDSRSNFAFTSQKEKAVGFVGVDNLIVVDTPDALLISKKGQSQKVSELYKKMESEKLSVTEEHLFDHRPWGNYEVVKEAGNYKIKVIQLDPGQRFSYQSHKQRSEHWVLVRGEVRVTLDGADRVLKAGEYIYIPLGSKHRMSNEGQETAEFVEVQIGTYLGEDDITRYSDDYGR